MFDFNWIFSKDPPYSDIYVTGVYTGTADGVYIGTIVGEDAYNGNADAFVYYPIDSTRSFAIETDPNQLTLNFFRLEQ